MSSSMDNLAKDLLSIMNETNEKKPTSYETRATVVRNDDEDPNIVWVHIPGGEPETPVTKSINAEKGDTVIVSVANGRGRVVGNITDPPASGSTIKEVTKLVQGAYTSIENLEDRLESGEFDSEAEFIEDSWLEYALSSSNSEFIPATGGDDEDPAPEEESDPGHYEDGWSQELPAYQPGYFYWMRTVTKLVLERVEDEESEDENLEPQEDEEGSEEEEDYILVFGEPRFYLAGQLAAESNYLYNKDIRHYFWHDNTGAYVTTSEDDYTEGFATHIISGSMELLYNGNPCTKWLPSGVAFYGASNGEYTDEIVASFGVGGIQFSDTVPFWIGNSNSYIQWDATANKIKIKADEIWMGSQELTPGGEWYTGTGITGTSTTATIFINSGVDFANEGDMYLNTSTSNTYRCTVAGEANTAKWVYVSNIKGANGDDGQNAADYYCMQFYSTEPSSSPGHAGLNIFSGYYYSTSYNKNYLNINSSSGMTMYINNAAKVNYGSSSTTFYFTDSYGDSENLTIGRIRDSDGDYYPGINGENNIIIKANDMLEVEAELVVGTLGMSVAGSSLFSGKAYFYGGTSGIKSTEITAKWTTSDQNGIDMSNTSGDNRPATIGYVKSKTSDRRLKEDIADIEQQELDFYKHLKPIHYKFKEGLFDDVEDIRIRYGFIAQDVETLMAKYPISGELIYFTDAYPGTHKYDLVGDKSYNLDYDSFHALHVLYAQHLEKRITELERRLDNAS